MRTVVLPTLRVHARRYLAAVVAVCLAVAFVVATNALTSAAKAGLLTDLAASYRGVDVVVTGMTTPRDLRRVVGEVDERGLSAAVNAFTVVPLSHGATTLGDTSVGTVSADPALRWQRLVAGGFPESPGETVVDQGLAEAHEIGVGDTLAFGAGPGRTRAVVTGVVASTTGSHQDDAYVSLGDLERIGDFVIATAVVVAADDPARTAAGLDRALHGPHRSLQVAVIGEHLLRLQTGETRGVDLVGAVMLGFAAIALFVAVLVIANTFAVLLAHRQRDFALLRCVGAGRRQVVRMVRVEALTVGAGSATLGLLVGWVLGRGLATLAGRFFPALPMGEATLSPLWLAGGWLAGVAVTLGASELPTRRSTRVSPVTALRPTGPVAVRSAAGRLRLLTAVLALCGGAALLALSIRGHDLLVMVGGGFVSFVGVLLLGPLLVPAAIRLVGALLGAVAGTTARLAAANAVRNPRRTAATAASLLVGVTLVAGMVVGMATVRATAAREMDTAKPVDASLTATSGRVGDGLAARVDAVEGVAVVRTVAGTPARVRAAGGTTTVPLLAPDAASADAVHGRPDFLAPPDGAVMMSWQLVMALGIDTERPLVVSVGDRRRELRVLTGSGIGDAAVVSPAELATLTDDPRPTALWVRAEPGADPAEVTGDLRALAQAAGVSFAGGLPDRGFVDGQLDVMLGAVVAMLAVGVVIALVGVGSTLGLSVLERTREHALLRALGLTRGRLRVMLAVEAMLLAGAAGLLGAVLGTGYAWVAVEAVVGHVVAGTELVVPWTSLAGLVALAAVAGLVAGVLPSRRAARVAPAAGLGSA